MILDVLAWLAVADAIAAALFAGIVFTIGRRSGVTPGQTVGLAIMLGLPATLLYVVVWLFLQLV